MDWNDLKLFLAVARSGSIRAAAAETGLNQSTLNRRMDVLEHDLNLILFSRSTRGFSLTENGRAIAAAGSPMVGQAAAIGALAETLRRRMTGTLKITAPQTVSVIFVAPIIEVFRQRFPDVLVEYDGSEARLDLRAGEADIAFRAGFERPDDSYVSDEIHEHKWGVYCSETYARRNGMPRDMSEIGRFSVVELGGPVSKGAGNQWFMSQIDRRQIAGVANSIPNMSHILCAGLGVGILPAITAAQESGLCRCFGPVPELSTLMWLVTTPEARRNPRVAAFVNVALKWFRDGHGELAEQTS